MLESSPPEGGDAGAPPDLLPGAARHDAALRGRGGREESLARGAAASDIRVDAVHTDTVVWS